MANSKATKISSVSVKIHVGRDIKILRKIASKRLVKLNREWKSLLKESQSIEKHRKANKYSSYSKARKDSLGKAITVEQRRVLFESNLWESILEQIPSEAEGGYILDDHKHEYDFQEDEYAE